MFLKRLFRKKGNLRHWTSLVRRGLQVLAAGYLLFWVLNLLFPLNSRVEYSVLVTDRKGQVIHAYLTSDEQWRMKTGLNEISPLLRKTILAKEDRYFYRHPGVNPFAVCRAMVMNLFHLRRTSGASTISMQVIRLLEPRKRTYLSKLIEMFRALQLERQYSKDQILQLYLNLVPYGGNIQGVKAAALLYFNKNPDHLSLAEITALSIIPNRPSSLVPGRNNDLIVRERNRWLNIFAREGIFSRKEIDDALSEPFQAYRREAPRLAAHWCRRVKGMSSPVVHSTLDMNLQSKTAKLLADYARLVRNQHIRQAAAIVLNNQTHEIVAYVGSADFNDSTDAGQVNGALAIREPGSTLKPLLYGLCMDAGLLTPKMVITDVPVNYQGYAPENYDRQFKGYVTMEYALQHSLNIPAVKSLAALGKDRFIRALASCRFRQIARDQRKLGLSMVLGGCGASLEELLGLYSLFACEGNFQQPRFLMPASGGQPSDSASRRQVRILSPAAAFMVSQILTQVNRPDFPLNWQSTEHLPRIAWKTGTSYGRRDAWSIGYNRKYTVAVWLGNFSGVGAPDLSGANIATPLLFRIFNSIDYDGDEAWFNQPKDCDIRQVCSETGLPPGNRCQHLIMDYFIPLVSPTTACHNQEEIMVSPDEKISYCRSCAPETGYKKKWYRIIAPEMQQYYEDHHILYEKIPPHNPACEKIFREGAPFIVAPQNGAEYLISRKNPSSLQLRCRAGNDVSRVYWYINNHFLQSAPVRQPVFFHPEEGPLQISCTDDKGRNRNINIRVRMVDY